LVGWWGLLKGWGAYCCLRCLGLLGGGVGGGGLVWASRGVLSGVLLVGGTGVFGVLRGGAHDLVSLGRVCRCGCLFFWW